MVEQFLNYERLIFGRTWIEIVWIALLALIGLAMLYVVKRILAVGQRGHLDEHFVWTNCDNCGWAGEVPKFTRKCPRCSEHINTGV